MKKLILALVLSLTVLLPRAQAVDTQLGTLRAEVANQLTIASNNVAATNNVVLNKKLIKTLQAALKSIDKTKTNYAAGAKTLSVLNKSLGRTVLSNEFNPIIDGTVDSYVVSLVSIFDLLEERVDASFPGKSQDAARKALTKLFAGIDGAYTNSNLALALKALAAATKAEGAALKATIKAENTPEPPAKVTVNISGTRNGASYHTSFTTLGAGVIPGVNPAFNGATGGASGLKQVNFSLINPPLGTSSVGVNNGNINILQGSVPTNFGGGTGTANVTRTASGAIYGTYTFTANGVAGTTGTVTVSGSFFGVIP